MALNVYLGIDVGSVTTKLALVDESGKYVDSYMLRTSGKPVIAVQTGMRELYKQALCEYNIQGVGTTGSGRNLAGTQSGTLIGIFPKIVLQFRKLTKNELETLRTRLNDAVLKEEFEIAAELRDKIREIERKEDENE